MRVLVDTSVWSLALRRPPHKRNAGEAEVVRQLDKLIDEGRVTIIGPIRQELLTGIRNQKQFDLIQEAIRPFPDEPVETADYETAAELANRCLGMGIAGTSIDLLICAVANRRGWAIYATDRDFIHYSRVAGVRLLGF